GICEDFWRNYNLHESETTPLTIVDFLKSEDQTFANQYLLLPPYAYKKRGKLWIHNLAYFEHFITNLQTALKGYPSRWLLLCGNSADEIQFTFFGKQNQVQKVSIHFQNQSGAFIVAGNTFWSLQKAVVFLVEKYELSTGLPLASYMR